jgi:hypothetical protein
MCLMLNLNTLRAGTSGSSIGEHVTPAPHPSRLKPKERGGKNSKQPMTPRDIVLARNQEKTSKAANKVSQQPDLPTATDHILF